eukprot:10083828-Alexandrium_andersonii.AAC.1
MRDRLSLSRPEPTRPGSWSPNAASWPGLLPGYRGGDSPSRTQQRADAAVRGVLPQGGTTRPAHMDAL